MTKAQIKKRDEIADSMSTREFNKRYGKDRGKSVKYATATKLAMKEESNPRIPRKKGQPANSKKHSDLYTDENPKGTIHGLGFKDVATAKASVTKIKKSSRSHAHKIQAAVAMEQRAREMGKTSEAAVYRKFINSMKKKTEKMNEGWSDKYKKSIDCDNPKGFSQKAHCQGKKKMNEETCPICGCDPCQCLEGGITEARDGKSSKDKGYSLRDWFKGGGWKQTGGKYDGKPCAKQPGQKTKPYCRDADDRAAMSKEERNKRAAKKRKEDPNPNRKGKAKNVTQESYSNWRTEFFEGYDDGDVIRPTDRIRMKDGKLRTLKDLDAKLKDKGTKKEEVELVDEGKKDACYYKVKSRYSVWPSAYASGALVKCRKVGAKNWGNKSKKNESVDYSNWRDDFIPTEYETTDLIKADPIQVPPSNLQKIEEAKKCWKGYKKTGTQKLFGKTYNRCEKIKKEHYDWRSEINIQEAIPGYEKYNAAVAAAKGLKGRAKIEALKAAAALRPKTEKEVSQKLGEDWQKSNRKDGVDGMSQKSVDAYKRENPGSKLKTAVTGKVKKGSKDAKRRKSFCSRSDGQRKMHNIDCKKTPDKKICKARRRWKC